jgi:hypothetical protein
LNFDRELTVGAVCRFPGHGVHDLTLLAGEAARRQRDDVRGFRWSFADWVAA